MKLILVRHGETEEEKKGVILGHLPGTLSEEGKQRANDVAHKINATNFRPEIILSSDLARALDYATIIGRALNVRVEQEPLLRERGAGSVEGVDPNTIDWEAYEKIPKPLRTHPGGESFEEIRIRAQEFLKKAAILPYGTALVVSHSALLAMLTMEVCGWTMDDALAHDFREPLLVNIKNQGAESLPPL